MYPKAQCTRGFCAPVVEGGDSTADDLGGEQHTAVGQLEARCGAQVRQT